MEDVEGKDDTDGWIKVEWKDSYSNKITPPVLTTTNNAFAILSVSNDPTTKQAAPVLVPNPISCKTDDKTIMFNPKEHPPATQDSTATTRTADATMTAQE
jgi:hypothetical protein